MTSSFHTGPKSGSPPIMNVRDHVARTKEKSENPIADRVTSGLRTIIKMSRENV